MLCDLVVQTDLQTLFLFEKCETKIFHQLVLFYSKKLFDLVDEKKLLDGRNWQKWKFVDFVSSDSVQAFWMAKNRLDAAEKNRHGFFVRNKAKPATKIYTVFYPQIAQHYEIFSPFAKSTSFVD